MAPEIYQPQTHVRYSGAITTARTTKTLTAAVVFRIYRFRQVKIKVGMEGYDDRRRLGMIGRRADARSTFASTPMRRGRQPTWSNAFTPWSRSASAPSSSRCRTPTPPTSARSASKFGRRSCSTNRCAAASMPNERWKDQTCDLFNLRLSKCGGFIPSLRLAQYAKQQGLGCQLGCQVGETAVLSAAGRHFAASVAGLRYLKVPRSSFGPRGVGHRGFDLGWGGWRRRCRGRAWASPSIRKLKRDDSRGNADALMRLAP